MKFLIKLFTLCIFIFSLSDCLTNSNIEIQELNIDHDEMTYDCLNLKGNFTISFWYKPLENYFDTTILTIEDGTKVYSLINDSYDENYYTVGVNLLNDNGRLCLDGEHYLETYNYNFITIDYYDNTFFLYLNDQIIGERAFDEGIDFKNLKVTVGSQNAKGIVSNLKICEHLKEEKRHGLYQKDIVKRLDNLNLNVVGNTAVVPKDTRIEKVIYDEELFFEKDGNLESRNLENGQITLKCNVDGHETEKIFEINFDKCLENVLKDVIADLGSVVYEKDFLISSLNDININYDVIEGNAEYDEINHYLFKGSEASEREKIKLNITVSDGNKEASQDVSIILLNEKYGQVLATFAGNDGWPEHVTGDESIYFYLGRDLKDWIKLNNHKVITSEFGTNRFRDPHVSRDKNGNFVIVATEGYANPNFYVAKSMDLIDFDVDEVCANTFDKTLGNNGLITWAPECYYNRLNDEYIIHYSESGEQANSIYAVSTKDFKNYSYPFKLFEANHQIIDSNVTHINNYYYMFYKNEEADSKKIYLAVTDDLYNNHWLQIENFEYNFYGYDQEGPFVYKIGDDYFLFADAYRDEFISFGEFHDNCYDWWLPIENEELNKLGVLRHFSIIDVTEKEYQRLVDYYGGN